MLHPHYPIRTERLALRPITSADTDAMREYKSDPDVVRYVPYDVLDRDGVERRIGSAWGRSVFDAPGDDVSLGVEETATGRLVGDVVLLWHSEKDRSGEVGYIFHPVSADAGTPVRPSRPCSTSGSVGSGCTASSRASTS